MKTAPLTSLGALYDDVCTTTLNKQDIPVQKNGQKTIKGTRNKKTGIWEVTLETQQSEDFTNEILDQASKPELVQYLHAELFSPSTASLLKEIKQGFPKTWPGITEKLIKKHLEKKSTTTTGHLNMRGQEVQPTKEKLLIRY